MISFNNLIYASFPVITDFNEVIEDFNDSINFGPYFVSFLLLTGFIFAIYRLKNLYVDAFNPWLRFLGLFGLIIVSIITLLFIFLFIILASENFDIGIGG